MSQEFQIFERYGGLIDALAACIIWRSMDLENYVETAKQTLRQKDTIKTRSWFTSP